MKKTFHGHNVTPIWTPEFFGPVYRRGSLILKEALRMHQDDKWSRSMATFVPSEIIESDDLTKKSFKKFNAILLLIDFSSISRLADNYRNGERGGTYALTNLFNKYLEIIAEEVYFIEGDVMKFSPRGILSMWKICKHELIFDVMRKVIKCALNLQKNMEEINSNEERIKVSMAISAGDVTFSIIGNEVSRHYIIDGSPLTQLKRAKRIWLPGDLVLSSNAWEHCIPAHYEFVIKDTSNIKIIKAYKIEEQSQQHSYSSIRPVLDAIGENDDETPCFLMENCKSDLGPERRGAEVKNIFTVRTSVAEAMRRKLGASLKTYLLKSVVNQIVKDLRMDLLSETKQLTIVCINLLPKECTTYQFISTIDDCYILLHSIVDEYDGSVILMNLYDKDVLFSIAFGLEQSEEYDEPYCNKSLNCSLKILQAIKKKSKIKQVFIGVSTGMVYCSVVGHISRKHYFITGSAFYQAMKIMGISRNKVSCDYNTVIHSNLRKSAFNSRGIRDLTQIGRIHIYEYIGTAQKISTPESTSSVEYCYPILGRIHELELFKEILENSESDNRNYCGMLITGNERSGKSRLLDAFVEIASKKNIKIVKLPVHRSHSEKSYAVIHHIFLQILDAEDSKSVENRERMLINKLERILDPSDFCYLNTIMRVCFPFSEEYHTIYSWKRHLKVIEILGTILNAQSTKICIFLDNFHFVDLLSWQLLSSIMDNKKVVIAMCIRNSAFPYDTATIEDDLLKDKRLLKRNLLRLETHFLSVFACQFLNVVAIPRVLDEILRKYSDNKISWCETFLMLTLQAEGIEFVSVSEKLRTRYDLVFPDVSLITKYSLKTYQRDTFSISDIEAKVCLIKRKYNIYQDVHLNLTDLRNELYTRMNVYEQEYLKCAAALGLIFVRATVQGVMVNSSVLHTAKTIAKMINIRMLECASLQRSGFGSQNYLFGLFKRRLTFSNMHHLVKCNCPTLCNILSIFWRIHEIICVYCNQKSKSLFPRVDNYSLRELPKYAHCEMLEFKIRSVRHMLCNKLSSSKKREYQNRALIIYKNDAKKCIHCGGGSYLTTCTTALLEPNQLLRSQVAIPEPEIRRYSRLHRIHSIRDTLKENKKNKKTEKSSSPRLSIISSFRESISEDLSSLDLQNTEGVFYRKPRRYFLKRGGQIPEDVSNPAESVILQQFSHVDYRNCECYDVISSIFWKLSQYLDCMESNEELVHFLLEYGAGLLGNGEANMAVKILQIAKEQSQNLVTDTKTTQTDKSFFAHVACIHILLGDAHVSLGNYEEAKKLYYEMLSIRQSIPQSKLIIYYKIFEEYLRLRAAEICSDYMTNRFIEKLDIDQTVLAIYLQRISLLFLYERNDNTARLLALRSLRGGFQSNAYFVDKSEIYLGAIHVFRNLANTSYVRIVEKLMINLIKGKKYWFGVEDVAAAARIFVEIYELRALRGEYKGAIQMCINVLRICGELHMNRLKLRVLPSFIEIMIWTKHISEAIDLMYELRFLSAEDLDKSALTWYYALSVELILDAGITFESYDSCLHYTQMITAINAKGSILRDPESLARLLKNMWIWQLRMGYMMDETVRKTEKVYKEIVRWDDFAGIYNCSKSLEYYLLILSRCIDLKAAKKLIVLVNSVHSIVQTLDKISKTASFIKPRLHLLKSYFNAMRGRKPLQKGHLRVATSWASRQGNKCMAAWILRNREGTFTTNNTQYWEENIAYKGTIKWQDVQEFNQTDWSAILYAFPVPNTYL